MNISKFNKVLYKGNINIDFYLYCLRKNPKIIIYPFINFFFWLLTFISNKFYNLYEKNKYKYLSKVKDLKKTIKEFYEKKDRINDNIKDIDIVVDKIPDILIPKDIAKNIIACKLNKEFKIDDKEYKEKIKELNSDRLYLHNVFEFENITSKKIIKVRRNSFKYHNKRPNYLKAVNYITLICFLVYLLTCLSFIFTHTITDFNWMNRFFELKLFLLNALPIFLCILLFIIVFKKIHFSFLLTSIVLIVLGVSSQTKLLYRDDVVIFSDLTLIKEAAIMTERYDIIIKNATILAIVLVIILFFVLKKYIPKIKLNLKKQILALVLFVIVSIFSFKNILLDEEIYSSVGDTTGINIWISTRQSQIRGLVYPFVYSINDIVDTKPEGYDEKSAAKILNEYKSINMKEEQKVNIIAIMLEAYQDMTKFGTIDIDKEVYAPFHEIQKKSISGELVTNIFGGGTVDSEGKFLTGYYDIPNLRKSTNSYVWYFKEQGYRTESMHPMYGAFYNRNTTNASMGFDFYYNYENYFEEMNNGSFVDDQLFFENIIKKFKESKSAGIPYFNFSVTYQNHGPYYSGNYEGKEFFFENIGYDEIPYNNVNEYLMGINKTNKSLKRLIDYFDKEEEPTIVILFGDHNPYLENVWSEFNINMDLGTQEGLDNYYKTPYIIHANEPAKKQFDKTFVGKGEDMSPMFLMSYLFEYCGIKGSDYNQYLTELSKTTNILNSYIFNENGKMIRITNNNLSNKIKEYKNVNYYYANNFKYKDIER